MRLVNFRLSRVGILAALVLLVAGASPQARQPLVAKESGARSAPVNRYGASVRDGAGNPITYMREQIQAQALSGQETIHEAPAPPATPLVRDISGHAGTLWAYPFFLNGIGATDLLVANNRGRMEIYAGGGPPAFGSNYFWHALAYDPAANSYTPEFVSPTYGSPIIRIAIGDVAGDSRKEIVVALSNGGIMVYDLATKNRLLSFPTVDSLAAMTVANMDATGGDEIVVCTSSNLYVYASGVLSWSVPVAAGASDFAVGQMDSDPAVEIALTSGEIVDAGSHTIQWNKGSAFGRILECADIDGDSKDELIAAEAWYFVWAYDVDTQLPKWSSPVAADIGALHVTDIDGDATCEVLIGDGQWGDVYAIDSVSLKREWAIANPESGVTDIAVGDVDGDGTAEVVWGCGSGSTGPDVMCVGNWQSKTIKWQSVCLDGPFVGPEIGDLDGDGADEVVAASWESDSGYGSGRILVFDALTMRLRAMSGKIVTDDAWTGLHDLKLRDVDSDGRPEILIAADDVYDGVIEIYDFGADNSFKMQWTNTVRQTGSPFYAVEALDVDGDGQIEILAGGGRQHTGADGVFLYVYNYGTRAEEWRSFQLGAYWSNLGGIAVSNLDSDPAQEIVAMVKGGSAYVFDGTSHAPEGIIAGNFTTVEAVGNTLLFGDTGGYIDQYLWSDTAYTRTYHSHLGSASIDGMTVDSMNPFSLWVGSNGVLSGYVSDVLQVPTGNYGVPYGARYRQRRTAGRYSLNASLLPAPEFAPEPPVTPGVSNTLRWTRCYGADQYMVEVDTDPSMSSPDSTSGWISSCAHTFSFFGLAAHKQTYYYRVKARRLAPAVESAWSRVVFSMQDTPTAATGWALYE